ncbi:alpha/beta hydrolase [Alteromonas pelagimontana]|uniref:Alpha/beta hydrolase n=2 Tax=Alteromonas pelagimontana TaxID=1858656 RepID=A0A6N3IX53_9ALTE|nr:alpha/beta hydrolase [Alteromonas pelagimontana]
MALLIFLQGAISSTALADSVKVFEDVEWAKPDGHALTMDIYQPEGLQNKRPVIVLFHGGGWLINSNAIMEQTSKYLAEHGQYVVANVNYRLLGDSNNSVHMNDIIEDALGAVLWVKANIERYHGDPTQVAVTGDSAGGHLAAMVVTGGDMLGNEGFTADKREFVPTWLPPGKSASDVMNNGGVTVQGAVVSYGAFNLKAASENGFESDKNIFWQMGKATARGIFGNKITVAANPSWYEAVSPIFLIPNADSKKLPPQFVYVGALDKTTPPEAVKAYADALEKAGQPVMYRVYPDRNHAFLDNGCNAFLDVCFDKHAPEVLDDAIQFLKQRVFRAD